MTPKAGPPKLWLEPHSRHFPFCLLSPKMDHEVPPFSQTDRSGCQPGARPGSAQARPRLGPGSARRLLAVGTDSLSLWEEEGGPGGSEQVAPSQPPGHGAPPARLLPMARPLSAPGPLQRSLVGRPGARIWGRDRTASGPRGPSGAAGEAGRTACSGREG